MHRQDHSLAVLFDCTSKHLGPVKLSINRPGFRWDDGFARAVVPRPTMAFVQTAALWLLSDSPENSSS